MLATTRWLGALTLTVFGFLVAAGPAAAQKNQSVPLGGVRDAAGLFSDAAVAKARREIEEIKRRTGKDLVIETIEKTPKKDADSRRELTVSNARDLRVNGVYVLISREPHFLEVVVGNKTRSLGSFTTENRNRLAQIMLAKLKESASTKDEKRARELRDAALLDGVAYVRTNMVAPPPVASKAPASQRTATERGTGGFFSGIGGWICIGLVVVLVLWLVIGLIRGMSGGGSPAYGGGYGGGGGGGGGFFSSLLGGMFGAAAGMWMYNHFFGGGTPSAGAGDYGGAAGGGAAGSEPTDTDYSGGAGGDWDGGDAGGGDAGGGGDWGGGDAGGGGDWGGGGDFGGGGGDW
ncbi:MAG: TPM domain-containing protein [Gemmataceae bacterium]|nr:TPM domain-containing protein [Gemmataceae bacterium]